MQPDKENTNDLEYLAQLGFENVSTNDQDLKELSKKVRERAFSYSNGVYFGLISLLTGVFLGVSVFFMYYNSPVISKVSRSLKNNTINKTAIPKMIGLDTVAIMHENFSYSAHKNFSLRKDVPQEMVTDSSLTINNIPASTLSSIPEKITEAQIKYIPNSPVIFLHDLKITNYQSLYFKQNKFISFNSHNGLDASYANPGETGKNDNALMPQSSYYLHQAISDAMLYFNRKDYSRCLSMLQMIAEINPGDINCKFYSGMCFFYKHDFTSAIRQFNDCINDPNNTFLNEAKYYRANALYESGNKEEAIKIFKEIANEESFYSEKAKRFLD